MALFDDILNRNTVTAAVVGLGAAMLAPMVLPALARAAKPAAKTAIKAGIVLYARGRETLAELGEVAEDALAEVKAEMAQEAEQQSASGIGGGVEEPAAQGRS